MRRTLSLFLAATMAAPAFADDGNSRWTLNAPAELAIGDDFCVELCGPPNQPALLFVSDGDGPIDSAYGTLCVDFPPLITLLVPLDDNGKAKLAANLGCDPAIVGFVIYSQFITCTPDRGASNGQATEIVDSLCEGDFCSFTQGGWGTSCNGGNPGCRRDAYFDSAFPNGLFLGDQDGDDDDTEYALILTSSAAVEAFLPHGGPSGTQDQDAIDPMSSSAGVFAGQLAAAKLNVGFDDIGAFDDDRNRDDPPLRDLVFVDCVPDALMGVSVGDLIDYADIAFSGRYGQCDGGSCANDDIIDIDGDTDADVSISDLVTALTALNENFVDCSRDNGCLGLD